MKRIGVLLACYNGETYLPAQLSSLRAQDDPAFTVLMQDDGSTDHTSELLAEVCSQDERFRMAAENGRRFGAIGNFLSLLRQDDSDYTALCDQDDLWAADRLSRCRAVLAEAEARLGADTPLLVHSDCRTIDGEGTPMQESFFAHQGWNGDATSLAQLLVQNNVTGCTLMMNAALRRLVAAHAQAEQLHMHDWFIALTAAAFGQVLFIPAPLVNYRQHGRNVMGASRSSLLQRGFGALRSASKAKARMQLCFTHARVFRNAYGDALPEAARRTVDGLLAAEHRCKPVRMMTYLRGGYLMQSTITRFGQMIFG